MRKLLINLFRNKGGYSLLAIIFFIANSNVYAFELGGFGDISVRDSKAEGERFRFELGRLDLYALKKFQKVSAFTEFVLEFDETGSAAIDLERLWVQYAFMEQLRISGGRFHTILGKWNRSYHHGAHLYNTIERPTFLNFEDDSGIMPSHQIGLLLDGKLRLPALTFSYYFMMGNGSKINDSYILDPNNVTDNNDNKSYSVRLVLSPTALDGLDVGMGGIFNSISSEDKVADEVAQNIWIFDLSYAAGPIEFNGEFFHMIDRGKGLKNHFNNFFYLQAAYSITEDIVPYYRFEKQMVREDDPYIKAFNSDTSLPSTEDGPVQDYEKNIVGLRYFLSFASSVKAEVRFISKRHSLSTVEYAAQWTYSF